MSNRKMNLDRPTLNSEQIKARQNFEQVLSKYSLIKPPVWKNPWFWGPTGLASIGIALFLSVSYINSQDNANDKNNTLTVNDLPEDTECIHPPLAGLDVPFQSFEINPGKDEEILLPSGTKIHIPAGSLKADDLGQQVAIEVREFQDKVSAYFAGIPMDYQQESAFESAGMIEIRGIQAGEVVEINPEKTIEVDMKLTKNPAGFDFWYLDEAQKSWGKYPATYETEEVAPSSKAVIMDEIKMEIARIDKQIEVCEQQKVELKKPLSSDYKIPQENHQMFDLDFDKKMYPELAKFENLIFEIIPTSGYDKRFTKKTWSAVKLEKVKDGYEMIFIASNDKMKVAVRPVLQGKELKVAEAEFEAAIHDFDATIDKLEQEKLRLEKEKVAKRTALRNELTSAIAPTTPESTANFQVNAWGVYNCDKPNRYPSALVEEPIFTWENSSIATEFKSIVVFNLDKDMRFSYGDHAIHPISNFGLHKNDDVVILGIEKGGDLGVCQLRSTKSKNEQVKFVFSKQEEVSSLKERLKKLVNETVSV